MKRFIFFLVFGFIFILSGTATAALWDRGSGLIYDDELNITWLQDANYSSTSGYDSDGQMAWNNAIAWADGLEYYDSVREVTWTNWRLPQTLPVNGFSYDYNESWDGSTDHGYNISAPGSAYPGSTGSELAYIYYNSLGNLGYYDTSGSGSQYGWGLQNIGPFVNLGGHFWSGTEYAPDTDNAWVFGFDYSHQFYDGKSNTNRTWAVMDGDVASIPIPGAAWLFVSGLIGLVAIKRKLNAFV